MDPAKMKVVDLRSELGALGLDTKGNKPALVERLRKALEAKTGKVLAETTILDTSTEDADEPVTPRKPGPASRTTRRSSSSRLAATPAKIPRLEESEPIAEEPREVAKPDSQSEHTPGPVAAPQPVAAPDLEPEPEPEQRASKPVAQPASEDIYSIDDEKSQSPPPVKIEEEDEPMEVQESAKADEGADSLQKQDKMEQNPEDVKEEDGENQGENEREKRARELTEEEEWQQLNERLKVKEQERLEREKRQAEDDARKLEEVKQDPVKLNRLKRKREKKARWSNFYKTVEVTNEILTPPVESDVLKGSKDSAEIKVTEPELDDEKVTLSWYDSDLNQYLTLPELNSVVPLSEGAFAHAWAGARASHGVTRGRVCYEVSVGSVVATTESSDKEPIVSSLRVGWSTDNCSLHLGDGETSWGYESGGRAVNNGEFKEYGPALHEKDVVGVYLDLESSPCKISYTVNGVEHGAAYEFEKESLDGKPLFPHVLTKNMCYKVNMGYDRYNMLTKTKIVRKRLEIPIEQVIEEKKKIEAELQRQKEEIARIEKEKKEKEKKEREERQRKRREEREKQDKERKAKEAQERKDKGEEVNETEAAEKEKEKQDETNEKDKDKDKEDEQPKENGDKPEEVTQLETEVKAEPMETDAAEDVKPAAPESGDGEPVEVTEEQVLKGQVMLDKRVKFVIRTNRPSPQQTMALVEFLERNPGIARGLIRTYIGKMKTGRKWQEFATTVNAIGPLVKSGAGWAKYWAERKCGIKKMCLQRAIRRQEGEVFLPEIPPLEQRLIAVIGGDSYASRDIRLDPGLAGDPFPNGTRLCEIVVERPDHRRVSFDYVRRFEEIESRRVEAEMQSAQALTQIASAVTDLVRLVATYLSKERQ